MPPVVDLSHIIGTELPVFPGTDRHSVTQAAALERDGFVERLLSLYSHTGTHMDAPAHMLPDGPTLDEFSAEHFVGRALIIDVSHESRIEAAALQAHAGLMQDCAFVLLYTGWSHYWGQPRYFKGFPVLSIEAAQWLAEQRLRGLGLDAASVDPVGSVTFGNHHALFRAGMVIIQNLTRLQPLVGRTVLFSCLPLKLRRADGSPVRAVAILD